MTRDETASYIRHHLALAGRGSDTLISDDSITLIHDTSRGLPRTVNNLCVAVPDRGLRGRAPHRRPVRRPRGDHRGHRDILSTTRDTPGTTQPRQAPPGGAFRSQDIPKISVTNILKINAAQQQHDRARATLAGAGFMPTCRVRGAAARADALVDTVQVLTHATSLGGVETTLERRARYPAEHGIPDDLLCVSVECEHAEDLWQDLQQALEASQRPV